MQDGRKQGRDFFLRRVAEIVPEVLNDLETTVFQPHRESLEQRRGIAPVVWHRPTSPSLKPVREAVGHWMERHCLNMPWVRSRVYDTLAEWVLNPSSPRDEFSFPRRLTTRILSLQEMDEMRFINPSWPEKGTPTLRTPGQRLNVRKEHFDWLVYYQAKGWSFHRIARDVAGGYEKLHGEVAGRKTVSEAVNRAAKLIGISLRPASKGGKPPKSGKSARKTRRP